MRKLLALFIVVVIPLVDARLYFPLVNATIPTGYIPPDFRTIEPRQASGIFVVFNGTNVNYNNTVVLMKQETEAECDINVRVVYLAGAVGAVCGVSTRTLGSSYTTFAHKTPFSEVGLITVDTYTALFANLTKLAGLPVIIDNLEGNEWLEVFTKPVLDAFVGTFVSILGVLFLVNATTLVFNLAIVSKKTFAIVYQSILTTATLIIVIGTGDYSGRTSTYGFWASFILTNLGIQMTFSNLWLYNLKVWELMSESVTVSNFVRYKRFFIILSIITPALDITLAVVSVFSPNPVWPIIRLVLLAVQMFACAAFYIVVIVRLKRFRAKENMQNVPGRKERIDRLINNCISITVMLMLRTSYAFISIVMFSAPVTVLIHFWIERSFAVYTVIVLTIPMSGSTLREYTKSSTATRASPTASGTNTSAKSGISTNRGSGIVNNNSAELKGVSSSSSSE